MTHTMRRMILRGLSPFRLATIPLLRSLLLLLFLPFWPAGDADAVFESALRGDYNETLYRSCAAAQSGFAFGSNFEVTSTGMTTGTTLQDFVLRETSHYNGDGTGNITGQSLAIFGTATAPTAGSTASTLNQATSTCSLTYTVNADGTFTQTANCNLTFIAGSAVGNTATVNGVTVSGQITLDGTVLIFNDTTPNVETFTWTSGPSSGTSFQRVCNGTGTANSRR